MIKYKRYISFIFVILLAGALIVPAGAQIPAPPQKGAIALTGGTIHPLSGPAITGGTIIFDNGRITAIGNDIVVPPGTKTVNISGKHVYPGFIETGSNLGLTEIGAVSAMRDYAEIGNFNPDVQAEVAVNAESEHFPVNRANGITLALSSPSGSLISGKAALLMMDGWTYEDMVFKAPAAMVMYWPRMSVFNSPWFRRTPAQQKKAIKENLERIYRFFDESAAYMKVKKSNAGNEQKTDLRYEAMIPVLQGKLPVLMYANGMKEMEMAIGFAEQYHLKLILAGNASSAKIVNLLKDKNIPLIVTGVLRMPFRRDAAYYEPFLLPKLLYDAGIKFCIQSSGPGGNRNLPYSAAMAAAFGLPKDAALKSITLFPAEIFGIAGKVGTLEKGKDATMIVTDGDPLDIRSHVTRMFIQGKDIDLNNKHLRMYKKWQKRYQQMKGE